MTGRSFLFGYTVFSGRGEDVERIINICNERTIPFSNIVVDEERAEVRFCVPLFYEKRMLKLGIEWGIPLSVLSRRGLPALVYRYRRRAGLLVGALLSALLFFYSSGLVWDVRIEGATRLSEKALLSTLSECGLSVGTRIKDIDADVLENQILILSDDISWVSVNVLDNVANVEIREIDYPLPDEDGNLLYANVVAKQDGVIVGFEDISGSISVDVGDAVSKDQLLISGVTGEDGKPMRLMRADGKVFAEVEDVLEIRIPRKYLKKVTSGTVKVEKSLIFFKNEIKFFTNGRNSLPTCDKIEVIENFYTHNRVKLPLAIKTVTYVGYGETEVLRSSSEARSLALLTLYRRIDEEFSDAELLSKSISFSESDDEVVLTCVLKCVKDIAELREVLVG